MAEGGGQDRSLGYNPCYKNINLCYFVYRRWLKMVVKTGRRGIIILSNTGYEKDTLWYTCHTIYGDSLRKNLMFLAHLECGALRCLQVSWESYLEISA